MSYFVRKRTRLRPGVLYQRLGGLGGFTDSTILQTVVKWDEERARAQLAPSDVCDAAGRAAQDPFYAKMHDIATSWQNRDGFFYLADATQIVQQGLAFQAQGQAILDKITSAFGEFGQDSLKSARKMAQDDLFDVGKTALDFLGAIRTATDKGATIIDAPGLRDWVIDCIGAAAYAAYVAAYTTCAMPAGAAMIITVMAKFTAAGDLFISIVKKAATVVAAAGDLVYKTTVGTLSFVSTVIKYAPYVALAYGASLLWKQHKK